MEPLKQKLYTALRGSEKFFKTDMIYLVKGGFWLTSMPVISAIAGFFVAMAVSRLLPRETYGHYQYILSVVSILAITSLAGLNAALIRAVAQGFTGTITKVVRTKILWGMLGGASALVIAAYYFWNGDSILAISFLIVALFVPFIDSFNIYEPYLHGHKAFKQFAYFKAISIILSSGAFILTVFITDNIFYLLFVYFITNTLINLFFYRRTLKKFKPNDQVDNESIRFGKHLSVMEVIALISKSIDKIVVWNLLGAVPLAIYAFATTPVTRIQQMFRSLITLALPKFSEHEFDDVKKALPRKMALFFVVIVGITSIYILLIPYVFQIFFPQYMDAVPYTRFLSLILLFYPFGLIETVLTAHAKQKQLYITNVISPILRISLILIMTPLYGLYGLIGARLLSNFLEIFLKIYILKTTRS